MKKVLLLAGILILGSCSRELHRGQLPRLDLGPGSERQIAYTNKEDAFWVTRSGGYQDSPWQGLSASKRSYFEDLFITMNGRLLPREEALVHVDAGRLERVYESLGVREVWTLLDGQRTLVLTLEAPSRADWSVQPAVRNGARPDQFEFFETPRHLRVHFLELEGHTAAYPWLQVSFSDSVDWRPAVEPGKPTFHSYLTPSARIQDKAYFTAVIQLADTPGIHTLTPREIAVAMQRRQDRLLQRLNQSFFHSADVDLEEAVAWAQLSLDALVMDQMGRGIYAGLPWFDDYWGRDLFISFPGALLVSGQWALAQEILLDFALYQDRDETSPTYGRIPNRVQPGDIIYNTADGTPWFVRAVYNTLQYSGEDAFLDEIYPAVRLATLGALENFADDYGFLTHADADTWMDARAGDRPWSPRGNRAVEIQFLWCDQLRITRLLANRRGDQETASRCDEALRGLEDNLQMFRNPAGILVDHLNADGSRDTQLRPNVLLVPPLQGINVDWTTFSYLAPRLVTRDGVLSLSEEDSNFHPYHQQQDRYVKDAAYHNGVIWNWNAGPVMTHALRFHQTRMAHGLFDGLSREILQRGAVGTLAELRDAWPRPGAEEPELSGTFSQAWSLAEYLRVFYQDMLGIQPDLSQDSLPQVTIAPRLASNWTPLEFTVMIGNEGWRFQYIESPRQLVILIRRDGSTPIRLNWQLDAGDRQDLATMTWRNTSLRVVHEKQMHQFTFPETVGDAVVTHVDTKIPVNALDFAAIHPGRNVPALADPPYRLLTRFEVKRSGGTLLHTWDDPPGDDKGLRGGFHYPLNPQFVQGIADLREMSIYQDEQSLQFELTFANLVDPGWHPEYGYQLTYAAIGLDFSGMDGREGIGHNARDNWLGDFKADRTIYVAGALEVRDESGDILAAYLPVDPADAIGDVPHRMVRFAIPLELLPGNPATARVQVAMGLQDDHGGAGLGDFRDVLPEAAEWWGGGGSATGSNVYDWLRE